MTAEEAVHQFGRLVLDTAWKVTRCPEDARDVHQEAFLKLHEALGKLIDTMDKEYGSFAADNPWLRSMIEAMAKQ